MAKHSRDDVEDLGEGGAQAFVDDWVEDVDRDLDAGPGTPWPLGDDKHGFYRRTRSAAYVWQGAEVVALQERLGVAKTGIFDDATSEAVLAFKAERQDLTPGEVVDRETWSALHD